MPKAAQQDRAGESGRTATWNQTLVPLDEQERQELVRLLKEVRSTGTSEVIPGHEPEPQEALRQRLLEKLRMYGA